MNALDRQIEYFKININHEYYQGKIPIALYMENAYSTQKYGINIRRIENSWIFYGREFLLQDFSQEFSHLHILYNSIIEKPIDKRINKKEELRKKDKENFEHKILNNDLQLNPFKLILKPQSSLFYYVTSTINVNLGNDIPIYSKDELISEITDLDIQFKAAEKHFEYIFSINDQHKNYKLKDSHGLIDFQLILNENNKKNIQFISKAKIRLSSMYKYQINLIEETIYGEKIVLSALKIPEPNSISTINSKQAVTVYYTI